MFIVGSLETRERLPELMDDPALDARLHRQALRGLSRINAVSRSAAVFWPTVLALARRGPIRVLDAACGGGDTLARLRRRADREGLEVSWLGCDISPTAVSQARESVPGAEVFVHDLLGGPLPGEYDLCINGLFLHHLDGPDVVRALRAMRESADAVAVSDLVRSKAGFWAAWLGTRLLSRSPVVHVDGPLSVRAAWTMDEMKVLADEAGMGNAVVEPTFPYRMRLTWRRG